MIETPDDPTAFVRARTRPAVTPFVPEVRLHVCEDVYDLWEAVEASTGISDSSPPFWGSPWPGGAALARCLLDARHVAVRGRSVVDVGAGSGLVAIAAALAGARSVLALDRDPYALAATRLNAGLNGVRLDVQPADVTELAGAGSGPLRDALLASEVVLAGDMFFERGLAASMLTLLRAARTAGAEVLVGDPGRAHLPAMALTDVVRYDLPVCAAIEGVAVRSARVLRVLA